MLTIFPYPPIILTEIVSGVMVVLTLKKHTDVLTLITLVTSTNVIFNVLIGVVSNYLSDRVWTKWGRRKPFLIVSYIGQALCVVFVPFAPNVVVAAVLIVAWMAMTDIGGSIYEVLYQETIPPKQRGRAQGLFGASVQLVIIFNFLFLLGRFYEEFDVGGLILTGEMIIYWIVALYMLCIVCHLILFVRETPVHNPVPEQRFSAMQFLKDLFAERRLFPVYLLAFSQAVVLNVEQVIKPLLYTQQWGYTTQDFGTNTFLGAIINIPVVLGVGYLADRFNRLNILLVAGVGSLVMQVVYYGFVQFWLPDSRPELWQIVAFGGMIAIFSAVRMGVNAPLQYDYVPRDRMGISASGISIIRSVTRFIAMNGVSLFITGYSYLFVKEGYDYFSGYLFIILMECTGLLILWNFIRLARKGALKEYGKEGMEST